MTTLPTTCHQRRFAAGLTLVEILVTVIVLAIGLLGLATLQLNALRNNTTAYERTQAGALAYSIIDRMRANSTVPGSYTIAMGTGPSGAKSCEGATADCSPTELAAYDLDQWECSLGKWNSNATCTGYKITGPLADGDGSIAFNGNTVTVTIQWAGYRGQTQTANGQTTSLSVSTVL